MADNKNIKCEIEKLMDDNYQYWSFQMKMLLQSKDMWEVIIGSEPENPGELPENETEMAAYQRRVDELSEWRSKSRRAMNVIALNVDRGNSNLIYNSTEGKDAWEILKNHHQTMTLGNKMRTKKKLFAMKLVKGGSMQAHLNMMIELFNKLSDLGDAMAEDNKITTILNSVEPEYEALTTAIMAWSEDRLTLHEVKERLIEEWEKKKDIRAQDVEVFETNWKAKMRCHGCKQLGHFRRDCSFEKKNMADLRCKLNEIKENKKKDAENYLNCFLLNDKQGWILDSGATKHMTYDRSVFSEIYSYGGVVTVANGEECEVEGAGTVSLANGKMILKNVLWVPKLGVSLISVRGLVNSGLAVLFDTRGVYLKKENCLMLVGEIQDGHYRLKKDELCLKVNESKENTTNLNESNIKKKCAVVEKNCVHEWHRIMAHRNLNDIKQMKKHGLDIKPCECDDDCEPCLMGKMSRKKFPKKSSETKAVLDVVVSDVCGPMQVETMTRKRYFITFIDVHSKYCEVKFIRKKNEAIVETMRFVEKMKTQFGRKPKVIRTDRGLEYLDEKLQSYLLNEGIIPQCTVGYCPEQNGVAERRNRTLMEAARTMLKDAKLPLNHWSEAVSTANYTINRILNKTTGKSPYEEMYGEKPKWNELRKFGSKAYVMIPKEKRRKLNEKSRKMKFVGYDEQSKGYRMSDGNQIIVSREVRFLTSEEIEDTENDEQDAELELEPDQMTNPPQTNETQEWTLDPIEFTPAEHVSDIEEEEEAEDFQSAEENEESGSENQGEEIAEEPELPRRSNRMNIGVLPRRFNDFIMERDEGYLVSQDPVTYNEAISSEAAKEWKEAMSEELAAIERSGTWKLVDLPAGRKPIGSKWVFKTKTNSDGIPKKRKARLVAQGFSQKFGIDYIDVFAPVARGTTMRMLLSDAGKKKLKVKQYDVKSAFLNGDLQEEIFMKPPPGVETNGKVCLLKKSLYGLKQAAHVWNKTMHESLTKNGCVQNMTDNCLYSFTTGEEIVHLLIHVDDILASTSNEKTLDKLMNNVGKDFELKSVGEAEDYLGIKMTRDEDGNFYISQEKFIETIIVAAGLKDGKASKFPIDTGYYKLDGEVLDSNDEYRRLIGMLLYVSTNTRPDIAASVSILSQRVEKPRDVDMNEVKRLIRYLKGTKTLKLQLSTTDGEKRVVTYSDSDWAEDKKDRKSNSGWYVQHNGGTIDWSSKKQTIVALSSAEAEYVALTEAAKEVIWVRRIAEHFGDVNDEPTKILTDSQSAMAMIKNGKHSNRTKHIDTKYHFVKDLVERKIINLEYHPTETNIADMLTKPLGGNKIQQLRTLAKLTDDVNNLTN